MPIDFEQLFNDDKTLPDTLEIPVGNEKISLGVIRDRSRREQKQLADQMAAVHRDREAVAARQKEAADMAEKATGIYNTLNQQLEAAKEEQARNQARGQTGGYDPEQLYQSDVWYAPIRKRDQANEETIKKISDQMTLLTNVVGRMGNLYTEDRYASEWESTADARKKSKSLGDWDFNKLRKYAEENKIVDKLGFNSIREAVTQLTKNERDEVDRKTEYERGLREGEMRARMGAMPRPASANAAMTGNNAPTPKTMDEALSPESISQDEELMKMLSDLQVQGADLLK